MSISDRFDRLQTLLAETDHIDELIRLIQTEVKQSLGINTAWLYVQDQDDNQLYRLVSYSGSLSELHRPTFDTLTIKGDPFLEQVAHRKKTVYCLEALNDPRTNKRMVKQLGNRTIFNTPITVEGKFVGILGVGTFGSEGPRPLTMVEQDYLCQLGRQLAAAIRRIPFKSP